MSFQIPEKPTSLPEITPVDDSSASSVPLTQSEAAPIDQKNIHLSLKAGEALHEGLVVPSHLQVNLPTMARNLPQDIRSVAQQLPGALKSLQKLDQALKASEKDPGDETLNHLQTQLSQTSDRVQGVLTGLQTAASHAAVGSSFQSQEESLSYKALEDGETLLRNVATGLTSKAAQLGDGTSAEPMVNALHVKESAFSGIEVVASGALVCKTGYKLHHLRQKLASLNRELQKHLAAHMADQPNSPSLAASVKAKMQHLVGQPASAPSPSKREPIDLDPVYLDLKIAELEKKIEETQRKIKETAVNVASSCVMTGANGAHFGLEVTEVAAREAMTHAATIAGPALGLVTGPLVLALAGKKLHSAICEHRALSEQLKAAQDPQTRGPLEEKIAEAKVTITRSGLSIAASAIGITSSALAVAAAAGVTGLGVAVAATGFGALAIGVAALAIGLGYLIYKNRAAIQAFLSKLVKSLHGTFIASQAKQEMKGALLRQLTHTSFMLNRTFDRTLIAHLGEPTSHETRDLEAALAETKRLKQQLLEALESPIKPMDERPQQA